MKYFQNMLIWIIFMCNVADSLSNCPPVSLRNGRIRYTNHGSKLTFICNHHYIRIGRSSIRCYDGEWSDRIPLCASKYCSRFSNPLNGKVTFSRFISEAFTKCDENFSLIGSPYMYCDTSGWNDTIPECQANSIDLSTNCTFESENSDRCVWNNTPSSINWVVLPTGSRNLSIPNEKLPPHDHTLAPHPGGHILYLKWNDYFYKPVQTDAAQYISPLFSAFKDITEIHCLIFYIFADGPPSARVEVFIGDDSAWAVNGNYSKEWIKVKIHLLYQPKPFRIIIKGDIKKTTEFTKIAIDDLSIGTGADCISKIPEEPEKNFVEPITTTITPTTTTTSMPTTDLTTTEYQIHKSSTSDMSSIMFQNSTTAEILDNAIDQISTSIAIPTTEKILEAISTTLSTTRSLKDVNIITDNENNIFINENDSNTITEIYNALPKELSKHKIRENSYESESNNNEVPSSQEEMIIKTEIPVVEISPNFEQKTTNYLDTTIYHEPKDEVRFKYSRHNLVETGFSNEITSSKNTNYFVSISHSSDEKKENIKYSASVPQNVVPQQRFLVNKTNFRLTDSENILMDNALKGVAIGCICLVIAAILGILIKNHYYNKKNHKYEFQQSSKNYIELKSRNKKVGG